MILLFNYQLVPPPHDLAQLFVNLSIVPFKVHSKTRTSVQLGILLGLSGNSGDGMGGGGGGQRRRVWEGGGGPCYALI